MPRGRRPTPPEIATLKGNPRKKRVRKPRVDSAPPAAATPADQVAGFAYPDFLTADGERRIFRVIVEEFLPRNLVRVTDFWAIGRYATFMHKWIEAKAQLGADSGWYKAKSKHNPDGLLRRHPAVQDMLDFSFECSKLEPQLGLTPLARNTIMARFMRDGGQLARVPGELPLDGGEGETRRQAPAEAATADASAVGFLRRHATPAEKLN